MELLITLGIVGAWIWSIARGIQVSFLCTALNFLFPPLSQLIYSIYEEKMRAPLVIMVVLSIVLVAIYGELSIGE